MPVVDANLVVEWLVSIDPEHPSIAAFDRLVDDRAEILAPPLLLMEVSNALLTGLRLSAWTGTTADRSRRRLEEIPIVLEDDPSDLRRAWELSRRFDDHPIYDMVYVALAERLGTPFITADARLRRRLVGVDFVISPEELLA